MKSLSWRVVWGCALAALVCVCSGYAKPAQKALKITARYEVPWLGSHAQDVRWAGPISVYLARDLHGVAELDLADGLELRRELVPQRKTFGNFRGFKRLAVSPDYLLVGAQSRHLAWRAIARRPGGPVLFTRKQFGNIDDFDLAGDRAVFLGNPVPASEPIPPGIVWIGNLSKELADLRAVMRDAAGEAGAVEKDWNHFRCAGHGLGAVRFLGDGSFLVVPGYQPGATLFTAAGQRARFWTNEQIGATTDCTAELAELELVPEKIVSWFGRQRVVEEILPLPQGLGLVVRFRGADGRTHWDLTVLRQKGGVETYPIPLADDRELGRLKGDVRDGKIVFLLYEMLPRAGAPARPDELFIAVLPGR
jgi:hypothetical protein